MKKTYISPEATAINIDIESICVDGSTQVGMSDTPVDGGAALSNEYRTSIWGD